jgi:hypothetical protein
MNFVLAAGAVFCTAVLCALLKLLRNMAQAGRSLPVTAEWISELSVERYKPMMRLLDGSDLDFLRSQPGFTPKAAAKLRAQRCQIFRGYLRSLSTDFGRINGAIKLLMLQSRRDRPDLALSLLRQQLLFAGGVLVVQVRLVLYRFGLCGVDVSELVRIFDSVRQELHSIVPSALVVRPTLTNVLAFPSHL